jgi:hypothetical protein
MNTKLRQLLKFELDQSAYKLYSTPRHFGRQAPNLAYFDRYAGARA